MNDKWRKSGRRFRDATIAVVVLLFLGWAMASSIANNITWWSYGGPFDKWRPLPWTLSGTLYRILPAPLYYTIATVGGIVFWIWVVRNVIDRIKADRERS